MINKVVLSGILLSISVSAASYKVHGHISDYVTSKSLAHVVITLANSTKSTCSNDEGDFEIDLSNGKNLIVTSEIGYNSDSLIINSENQIGDLNISLKPAVNPKILKELNNFSVEELLIKAIKSKENGKEFSTNYEFNVYNRYVIRENNNMGLATGNIRYNFDQIKEPFKLISNLWDSTAMEINGIGEYVSRGFYQTPNDIREIVEAKRPHLNFPRQLASVMGTRRLQNLYSDFLSFYDRTFPGPFSSNALEYYNYKIIDVLLMDNNIVDRIYFQPKDKNDPGLSGYLYLSLKNFKPIKIEADLNTAAIDGGSFQNVSVMQQFKPYFDNLYLPVDYFLTANSSYLGIVKTEYNFNAIMSEYKMDPIIPDNLSGNVVFSVMPDAEVQSSSYWKQKQAIPLTSEEVTADKFIDSISTAPKGFIYQAAKIFSPQYNINDNFSVNGPFSIYQFNHVEGHTLYLSVIGKNLLNNRLDGRVTLSNGFSDKKLKETAIASFYPGDKRTFRFSVNAYNKLNILFSSSDSYNSLTSTVLSLFSRRDFRNYYYTKGFDLEAEGELSSFIAINSVYSNHTDNKAYTNSTFVLLPGSSRGYFNNRNRDTFVDSVNAPIFETHLNTFSFDINFDFRDYVSDNFLRKRVSEGNSFITFGAGVLISDSKLLKSSIGFLSYNMNVSGEIKTFNTATLGFRLTGVYSDGPVPFQMQYALPGNITATGRSFSFRSIGISNMFGDQTLSLNLEHNFREETSRIINYGFFKYLKFNTFFNAAWKNMSAKSAAIMPVAFTTLKNPLFEAGFSIGYATLPASVEFSWRLNHIERSAFRIGINTSLL